VILRVKLEVRGKVVEELCSEMEWGSSCSLTIFLIQASVQFDNGRHTAADIDGWQECLLTIQLPCTCNC
jgi:hypothetical protein